MKEANKKAEQITSYYLFHKKIELIFQKGINHLYKYVSKNFFTKFFINDYINEKQEFFILEDNFVKTWKSYVNYDIAKKYLDKIDILKYNNEEEYISEIKECCENMILTGEINNDEKNKPTINLDNNHIFSKKFIHKLILNLDDFDSLIDIKTYLLFRTYNIFDVDRINGFLLDKIIVLIVRKELKMKFLFSLNNNMIQLLADFII